MAADYFVAAYGEDGPACGEFLAGTERLSAEIDRRFRAEEDAAAPIEELRGLVEGFGPVLERNESAAHDECRAESWRLMALYVRIMREFVEYAAVKASGHPSAMAQVGHPLREYLNAVEDDYQPYLTPRHFLGRLLR